MNYNSHHQRRQDASGNIPAAWKANARELANWASLNLINRHDVYGQYLPREQRSSTRKAKTKRGPLTEQLLVQHFRGNSQGDLVGLHTTSERETCRWSAIDIDHHGEKNKKAHRKNRTAARKLYRQLKKLGFRPLLISSNGRGGYHLLVLFEKPIPVRTAYRFAQWLIRDWAKLGLSEMPETFPRQSELTVKCKLGNWLRLPGRHHTLNHYSQVWNGKRWLRGDAAIKAILATEGQSPRHIPTEVFSFDPREPDQKSKTTPNLRPLQLTPKQANSPIAKVLRRLDNVRQCSDQWSARCPAHSDRNNSLSIAEAEDGTVLLYCHAGCEFEDILEELELFPSDLFSRRGMRRRTTRRVATRRRTRRESQ